MSRGASFSAGTPKKRLVVLGAGLAGLTSAWELDQAGDDVVVIEAQTRAGGRALTLRKEEMAARVGHSSAERIPRTLMMKSNRGKQ